MNRKIPTTEDRAKARRLKTIWTQRKAELGLTQIEASKKLNVKQPTLSQYLNCVIPLNTDMILKFSALLRISPSQIDPELKNVNSLFAYNSKKTKAISIPLIGSISGESVLDRTAILTEDIPSTRFFAGIVVDDHSLSDQGIPKDSTIIVELTETLLNRDGRFAVRLKNNNGYQLVEFQKQPSTSIKLTDVAIGIPRTFLRKNVLAMHPVYTIAMP